MMDPGATMMDPGPPATMMDPGRERGAHTWAGGQEAQVDKAVGYQGHRVSEGWVHQVQRVLGGVKVAGVVAGKHLGWGGGGAFRV